MKKVIWSSDIDLEDYKEVFEEEYPDVTNESEMYGIANDMNDMALEDERLNLDIQLENDILAIADIGCWNGRKTGYKIIESGNIQDILYGDGEGAEWYSDGYNIKATLYGHDGTSYVEYREIRPNRNIQNLLDKLYNNEPVSRAMINYYTKSIEKHVTEVYGW